MESTAGGWEFGLPGGAATDLTYVSTQLPLAVNDRSPALIQLTESLGGERTGQSQLLLLFSLLLPENNGINWTYPLFRPRPRTGHRRNLVAPRRGGDCVRQVAAAIAGCMV